MTHILDLVSLQLASERRTEKQGLRRKQLKQSVKTMFAGLSGLAQLPHLVCPPPGQKGSLPPGSLDGPQEVMARMSSLGGALEKQRTSTFL